MICAQTSLFNNYISQSIFLNQHYIYVTRAKRRHERVYANEKQYVSLITQYAQYYVITSEEINRIT